VRGLYYSRRRSRDSNLLVPTMMATTTPWQGEPDLSESIPVAGKKRQRPEPQQQQQHQQPKRSPSASQSLPTTGYDVLLVGERSYTQVLAQALLQVSEHNIPLSSTPSAFGDETTRKSHDGSMSSSSVDRLAIDALQRTLSKDASVSAIWKRRHVHMVESLSTMTTTTTPSTTTSQHADGDGSNVDVDRMNYIVIVVPTAFSPNVWETVPLSGQVQRELDAITNLSSLRESLLLRQRVSLVAIVGANNDSMTTGSSTTTASNNKTATTRHDDNVSDAPVRVVDGTDSRKIKSAITNNIHKAHSYVPMFLCHARQDASFHCTARQLWKRIAIGARTDPVSTVSPLLLARKYREYS
jgi:hypothetical protein